MLIDEQTLNGVRRFMQSAGLTQRGLAELVGVSAKTVNRWLTGKAKRIKPDVYARLLHYVDPDAPTGASPFVRYVVSNWDLLPPDRQNKIMGWILEEKERITARTCTEAKDG